MALEVPNIPTGDLDAVRFHEDIVGAGRPVLLRGLLADWPVVQAAQAGTPAFAAYLRAQDRGARVKVKTMPAAGRGRLFYDDVLRDFNFDRGETTVSDAIDRLLRADMRGDADYLAIQSVAARKALPDFVPAHAMPLLPETVEPRLWIGNAVTVVAHFDSQDNIACVAAGQRRFTLFPPDQVANLYPGPFERTPAGAIVSMVDFDAPDFARHPGFREAMEHALIADLMPGDAIYIPALWWHHVRSLAPINMLVNYWWTVPSEHHVSAMPALMHAMLAIKHLPEPQREAWRALFDHYAFARNGAPGLHLPANRRGIQGEIGAELARASSDAIVRALSVPAPPSLARRARGFAGRLLRRLKLR